DPAVWCRVHGRICAAPARPARRGASRSLSARLDGLAFNVRIWTPLRDVYAGEGADDRVAEDRYVVRFAGRDQVAVLDDRLVDVEAARVLDVDGDRWPAGQRAPAEGVRRDQELGTVTDRG